MWQWFLDLISHPATEAAIHLMVLAIFFMELWQHWTHHKKQKSRRGEKLYTLDEAKAVLFETVALADPSVFALPGSIQFPSDLSDEARDKFVAALERLKNDN